MAYITPIENRNFLAPTGFIFRIDRIPQVSYFCNQANIPSMDLGIAIQPSYLKDVPVPGDKIEFGDLSIRFLIDENFGNYMEIQKWIRGLGFPESLKEFNDFESQVTLPNSIDTIFDGQGDNIYSDGTLQILSSNNVPKFQVNFKDMFPYSLSTLTFDATDTDIEYFTAEVSFKYTNYTVTNTRGQDL